MSIPSPWFSDSIGSKVLLATSSPFGSSQRRLAFGSALSPVFEGNSLVSPINSGAVVSCFSAGVFCVLFCPLLYPVHSLRAYLERMKAAVSRVSLFFVSPRSSSRQISKNAVSFFLREVILGAGAVHEDVGTSLRVHSIRGVATSTVFKQNWSVSKVLEASSWRSISVFASFYFRDVQYIFEGLHFLGPFVAAGSVLP